MAQGHDHVAVALIGRHGRWLVQQRRAGVHLAGLWEFPGGKVGAGESIEEALRREVIEEVGVAVASLRPLRAVEHDYGDRRVTLHPFLCTTDGEPRGCEGQPLRWVTVEELTRLPTPAANHTFVAAIAAEEGWGASAGAADPWARDS